MNQKRWWITLIVLFTFIIIMTGIFFVTVDETPVSGEWKELLLILLGAFIGTYNKAAEFWFGKEEKDKLFLEKIDDEDDELKSKQDSSKKVNKKDGAV